MSGRGLTADQIAMLQLEDVKVKMAIEVIYGSLEWRFCTGSVGLYHDSNLYNPRGIRVSASTDGDIDGIHMTVELDNRNNKLSAGVAGIGGLTGAIVTATLFAIVDDIPQSPIILMRGDVTRCLIGENLKIEVGPLNRGKRATGLYKCSRMCPYTYGDELCKDTSGDAGCRRTLDDCNGTLSGSTKSNGVNFGGFIWALEAGESIMVEAAPVQVQSNSSSNSGDGMEDCHSGRFVTLVHPDGSTERVELRCDIDPMSNGGDHTDGYHTDPWTLLIDDLTEDQEMA